MGQVRPGDAVRFKKLSIAEAYIQRFATDKAVALLCQVARGALSAAEAEAQLAAFKVRCSGGAVLVLWSRDLGSARVNLPVAIAAALPPDPPRAGSRGRMQLERLVCTHLGVLCCLRDCCRCHRWRCPRCPRPKRCCGSSPRRPPTRAPRCAWPATATSSWSTGPWSSTSRCVSGGVGCRGRRDGGSGGKRGSLAEGMPMRAVSARRRPSGKLASTASPPAAAIPCPLPPPRLSASPPPCTGCTRSSST